MLGKLAFGGVAAAVAGYKKLEGMESDDIRGIAGKISKAAMELGEAAKEKADKLPFMKSLKETIASNKTASNVFSIVGKAASAAGKGVSHGFQGFMERMADAKDAADKDKEAGAEKSTFLKRAFEQMRDGVGDSAKKVGKGAVLGAAGLLAKMTGSDKMKEAVEEMRATQKIGPAGGLYDAVQTEGCSAERVSTVQVIEKDAQPEADDKQDDVQMDL